MAGWRPFVYVELWIDKYYTYVADTQSHYDIMVCFDLEAILARVKISPCVQFTVQCSDVCSCTVHCTVTVQHEWSQCQSVVA